jgi:hypothetical protein
MTRYIQTDSAKTLPFFAIREIDPAFELPKGEMEAAQMLVMGAQTIAGWCYDQAIVGGPHLMHGYGKFNRSYARFYADIGDAAYAVRELVPNRAGHRRDQRSDDRFDAAACMLAHKIHECYSYYQGRSNHGLPSEAVQKIRFAFWALLDITQEA